MVRAGESVQEVVSKQCHVRWSVNPVPISARGTGGNCAKISVSDQRAGLCHHDRLGRRRRSVGGVRLGCSVLPRIHKEGDYGFFAKRLSGLQPVQTFNKYEARAVRPD
jgi:hypothetical protein